MDVVNPRLDRAGFFDLIRGPPSSLLAPEHNMDSIEFLGHTCLKAGLSPDAWLKGAEVSCFEGQIFKEKEPQGEVIEESYSGE